MKWHQTKARESKFVGRTEKTGLSLWTKKESKELLWIRPKHWCITQAKVEMAWHRIPNIIVQCTVVVRNNSRHSRVFSQQHHWTSISSFLLRERPEREGKDLGITMLLCIHIYYAMLLLRWFLPFFQSDLISLRNHMNLMYIPITHPHLHSTLVMVKWRWGSSLLGKKLVSSCMNECIREEDEWCQRKLYFCFLQETLPLNCSSFFLEFPSFLSVNYCSLAVGDDYDFDMPCTKEDINEWMSVN